MRVLVQDKYTLRDLHREIDLLDRKLAHIQNFAVFETDALRDAAVRKAKNSREKLMVQAQAISALGIEYHEPVRSEPEAPAPVVSMEEPTISSDFSAQVTRLERENSIAESSLAAWQDDLEAYKKKRSKPSAA